MSALDDALNAIKQQRRAQFQGVMNKLVAPATGHTYHDYGSTYVTPTNQARMNAVLSQVLSPTSAAGKAQALMDKQQAAGLKSAKQARAADIKAKKAQVAAAKKAQSDYVTVQNALNHVTPLVAPETAGGSLHGTTNFSPATKLANQEYLTEHAPTFQEVQNKKISELAPEQLAELPLSVQKIMMARKDPNYKDLSNRYQYNYKTSSAEPQSLQEALGNRPDVFALTESERNALPDNATPQQLTKAVQAKFTDMLVKANAGQGALGLSGQVKGQEGWLNRDVINHLPSPVRTNLIKGLDYIDRPRNAIVTGQKHILEGNPGLNILDFLNMHQAPTNIAAERIANPNDSSITDIPGNTLEAAKQFGQGAASGFTGKEHTGYGDLVEKQFPTSEVGNGLLPRWGKRIAGGAGDAGFDPATYVSFGVKNAAKAAFGKKSLEALGDAAAKEVLAEGGTAAAAEVAKFSTQEALRAGGKNATETLIKRVVSDTLNKKGKIAGLTVTRNGTTVAAKQAVLGDVQKAIDKVLYETHGGPLAGSTIGDITHVGKTVMDVAAEASRSVQLEDLSKFTKPFVQALKSKKGMLTKAEIDTAKAANPLVKIWHDAFVKATIGAKGVDWDKALEIADKSASKAMNAEARDFALQGVEQIRRSMLKIPTIRVMGQQIAEFPRVGRFAEALTSAAGKGRIGEDLVKAKNLFSYHGNFPGYTTLIGQKVRAEGLHSFNNFRDEVVQGARGVSKEDAKAIQDAVLHDTIAGLPADLQAKAAEVQRLYSNVRDEEVAAGIRYGKSSNASNYTHLHLHGGKETERAQFRNEVRDYVAANGKLPADMFEQAQKRGLRPEANIYKNLIYKKLDSNRRLTQKFFENDVATHYGIQSTMGANEATRRGLIKVSDETLPSDLKKIMKPGHSLYLDKDIHEIVSKFSKLNEPGSQENRIALKTFDYLTRKFKTLNTIYYPGFHVRNMISDLYMGMLDGVSTRDYGNIVDKMIKGARNPTIDMDIGGRTVKYARFKDAFQREVSSGGFLNTEMGTTGIHPKSLSNAVRRMSESREDLGRMAHFKHAMDEELPAQLKRTRDFNQAWDAAVNASIQRVNKFKFDYGALTKFESQVMRRGIPFYTYMRKAIPTLAESTLMSPRVLSYTNRWMKDLMPKDKQGGLDVLDLPDWIKNVGFAHVTDGPNPWGFTGQALPQDTFNHVSSVRDIAAQANPLIRGPFELAQRKTLYNNKPVNNVGDLITNNIRAFNTYDKMFDGTTDMKERLANIMGIPLVQINEAKKAGQRRKMLHDFNAKIGLWNEQAKKKGYTLNLSQRKDGVSLRVGQLDANKQPTGRTKDFQSLDEALQFLGLK